MSSTNKTTYYELPQFVDNDLFNPLVDDNDAYNKIDTALHNIADAEANDASEIVGIKSRLVSAEGDIDALEAQNGNSVLTTTAQTLSGAINEIDADTSALDGRLDIVEDDINNASTGLKAKVATINSFIGDTPLDTDAQTITSAINEVDGKIGENTILTENITVNEAILTSFIKSSNAPSYSYKNIIRRFKKDYSYFLTGDNNINNLQGCAYDTIRNRFMYEIVNDDDTSGVLALVDANDPDTLITRKTYNNGELGHGNQCAFNSDEDAYVCVANQKDFIKISSTTLDIISTTTLPISSPDLVHGCIYIGNGIYKAHSSRGIYTLDSDFNILSYDLFSFTINNLIEKNADFDATVTNGMAYYDGNYYIALTSNGGTHLFVDYIIILDADLNILSIYDLSNISYGYEIESLFVNANGVGFIGQSTIIFASYMLLEAPKKGVKANDLLLANGMPVVSGGDVDIDCFDYGSYYMESSDDVLHLPFKANDLKIISLVLRNRPVQIAFGGHLSLPSIAFRVYNLSNDVWGTWYYNTNVTYLANGVSRTQNSVYAGYVGNDNYPVVPIDGIKCATQSSANNVNTTVWGTIYHYDGTQTAIPSSAPVTASLTIKEDGMLAKINELLPANYNKTPFTANLNFSFVFNV